MRLLWSPRTVDEVIHFLHACWRARTERCLVSGVERDGDIVVPSHVAHVDGLRSRVVRDVPDNHACVCLTDVNMP